MSNFAPHPWRYKNSPHTDGEYRVYDCIDDTEVATVHDEPNARLIAVAPELYWGAYSLLYELKQGNGSNPEYVKQVIPQMEELLTRIKGTKDELKPCPFCGGKARVYRYQYGTCIGNLVQKYCAECTECKAELPMSLSSEKLYEVVSNWNRRGECN